MRSHSLCEHRLSESGLFEYGYCVFFSSRRRHTRFDCDWSSDVCSSDLLGADVIAVEPDPAMLGELRRALPAVRALPGSAGAIPLPDASVDAVLAGNALHWFDMAAAGPEIARVLAPGGILAGLWNVLDDRVDWVAGLERVSGSAAIGPRDTLSSWRAATAGLHLPDTGLAAQFGSPEQAEFQHGQRRIADSLVATLATRAGVLV